MNYELAKELKKAGFPFRSVGEGFGSPMLWKFSDGIMYNSPFLEEFIMALSKCVFLDIAKMNDGWLATDHYFRGEGTTPVEAIARLWLALNKHD